MVLQRTETGWAVLAPAKLNLYLEVLGRRDDGFHEVETLVAPVRLYDEVRLRKSAAGFHLTLSEPRYVGDAVPSDASNLVVRAVRLLAERAGYDGAATIHLLKRIPAMAGLGGGSSDAAAALVAANAAWQLGWSVDRLTAVAAELGSDVPFFLVRGAAVCRGRGDRVESVEVPAGLPCVIVQPSAGLSTAEVYSHLVPSQTYAHESGARLNRLIQILRAGDWRGLSYRMCNRLQAAAAQLSPWVHRLVEAFSRLPFIAHQLTGSGSAYFGLCRTARQAQALGRELASRQLGRVFVTSTCR
jgi:4-diphosphocytidyl-2-C-methyl-D-erythritol kinase